MSMFTMLSTTREKALTALADREVGKQEQREIKAWQAAVAEIGKLEIERDRVLTDLAVEESKTRGELEKLRPAWEKATARYGYARRNNESHRYDYSHRLTSVRSDAEALAPTCIRRLRDELVVEIERTRKTAIESEDRDTGALDPKGRPITRRHSNHDSIVARMDAIRKLVALVDELKIRAVDDVHAECENIRKAVPPAEYPIT